MGYFMNNDMEDTIYCSFLHRKEGTSDPPSPLPNPSVHLNDIPLSTNPTPQNLSTSLASTTKP